MRSGRTKIGRSERRDEALSSYVEKVVSGDRTSERAILELLAAPLKRTLARQLGSRADVDDALQETLLAILKALPRFRGESSVLHFARRIATLHGLTSLRRAFGEDARRARVSMAFTPQLSHPPPRDELLDALRKSELRQLLAGLPPVQAEALVLHFLRDCSLSEISAMTATPINTVRTRLRLARATLRRRVTGDPKLRELFGVR